MSTEPNETPTTGEDESRLASEKAKLAQAQADRDRLQKLAEENVKEMLKTWPGVRDEQAHKLSQLIAENKRLLKEKQYAEELNKKAKMRRDELDIEKLEARHLELIESIDKQKCDNKERGELVKMPIDQSKEEEYARRHKTTSEHHSQLLDRFKSLIAVLGGTEAISEDHRNDFKTYNEDILYWATQNYKSPPPLRNQPRPALLIRYARTLMASIVGNKGIPLMQKEANQGREEELRQKKSE
eukprot:TRINITY_DN1216_c3_g1_i3.p1 TRINITY_DN1216_c3_g1~~TRINITY_DN1216_c3_g1_i3.p1  ORF type:complete len:242 (+),score=53.24 TRINITY_DN1216_c3_g1_i3:178-903(+)